MSKLEPDATRPPAGEPLLSYPSFAGLSSCLGCRCTVIAVTAEERGAGALLLDPSSGERRWLWATVDARVELRFSPWVESWAIAHDCPGRRLS